MILINYGFVRVAAAVPEIRVADCDYNAGKIIELMDKAVKQNAYITVFPELCITGYTCGDLFGQSLLLKAALKSLKKILDFSSSYNNVFLIGLPLLIDKHLYNSAVVVQKGRIAGIVPKINLKSSETRWFREGSKINIDSISLFSENIPCGIDLVFNIGESPGLTFAVELSEDMCMPVPPSSIHAINGALILCNLSAGEEIIGSCEYRKTIIKAQSSKCIAGYIYSSAGVGESTTDQVFAGHGIIAENSSIVSETERFRKESQLVFYDIDIQRLMHERLTSALFFQPDISYKCRKIPLYPIDLKIETLTRVLETHPFVPANKTELDNRCREIFSIQTAGLAKRLGHTGLQKVVIGVSGGLDSTLALLVVVQTFDRLKIPRKNILAVTMPGFGTTKRTYDNALKLMSSMGVQVREIDIKNACIQHFKDIGHDVDVHDVTYENVQARERTQILMDIANKEGGLVIGTGDLSELALGWCTYNGDHMSMYSVNCGIPKTLVKHLVLWVAENIAEKEISVVLHSIVNTPITPELLPPDENGRIEQRTEDVVGPYELHDFFLYHMVRYGASPKKIRYLANIAFQNKYDDSTILKWLKVFYNRFFTQQFKRSCLPDGPKVGTISLSPRGDWSMPSDASAEIWLKELHNEKVD